MPAGMWCECPPWPGAWGLEPDPLREEVIELLTTDEVDMTLGSRQTEVGLATRAMVPLPPRTAESDADCPPLSEELLP